MKNKKYCIVLGTRPEIIKMAPIMLEMDKRKVDYFIIHTNQHSHDVMSFDFFKEFELPKIKYILPSPFELSECYQKLKNILRMEIPDYVFVQGDTDSALAGCLAGHDCAIPVIHRESGVRSFDHRMHEEKNRIMIDKLSDIHFVPTKTALNNLAKEEVNRNYLVGNTLVDSIRIFRKKIKKVKGNYILFTFHRKENIDNPVIIENVMNNLRKIDNRIIFPIHVNTKRIFQRYKIKVPGNVTMIDPTDYIKMLSFIKSAKMVITDSGGIQEESCILGTSCIVLRRTTDRPEAVKIGASILINPENKEWGDIKFSKKKWKHPYGSNVAKKIINVLLME